VVTSPSSSVRQAREELAQRLRDIRIEAGLPARAIARAAGWHESKCSRIEHARTAPSPADIRAWCNICGAESEIPGLLASLHAADSAYVEWRRLAAGGFRHLQSAYVPLYERTRRIGCYQSHVVPGLLQTESYAAALIKAMATFHGSPDDSAKAAAARVARSRVLYSSDHEITAIVEEAVLTYCIGGPLVMAGQLGYLLDVMGAPGLRLGVIPAATERPTVWTLEGFTAFDEALVQVELLSARVVITRPHEAGLYVRALAGLGALAVYGREARELISAALAAFS